MCPHFLGLENLTIKCTVNDKQYKSICGCEAKVRTRCKSEYNKCSLYKRHNAESVGAVCSEYLCKSSVLIYCKNGSYSSSNKKSLLSYYSNKCCSEYGHKTCCNYPNKVEHKEQKKQQISFIDEIIFSWKHRKGAV
jgi:hypothetical protein